MPDAPIIMRGPIDPSQVDEIVRDAESKIIAARPGAVPPHLDDGGHLPFGGSIGGTRGPSMFGKRKIVTSDADPNPQALLLNFPPKPSQANIINWEKNYRSNMYEDPTAEAVRFDSTNYNYFGRPTVPSYLAESQKSMGNLRQSANTRPTPSPAFYPPERETEVPPEKCDYNWTWPERQKRPPPLEHPSVRPGPIDGPSCVHRVCCTPGDVRGLHQERHARHVEPCSPHDQRAQSGWRGRGVWGEH